MRVGKILEHPNQQRPAGEPAPVKAETSELQPGAQGTGTRGTGSLRLSGILDCRQTAGEPGQVGAGFPAQNLPLCRYELPASRAERPAAGKSGKGQELNSSRPLSGWGLGLAKRRRGLYLI